MNYITDYMEIPAQFFGDPKRQAVHSIRGTVYQAWCSIDAWLKISNPDEVIYLEGAEDFDVVKSKGGTVVQVRNTTGSISLGTEKAHVALKNFWDLTLKEQNRRIEFRYLTTSSVALERDAIFDGRKGIDVWKSAQTNVNLVDKIAKYLIGKLGVDSPLSAFLSSSSEESIQKKLIQKFHWMTNQPGIDTVKGNIDNRIAFILKQSNYSLSSILNVRKYLESRFWEIITKRSITDRCLTYKDLFLQIEDATSVHITIPIDRVSDLITGEHFSFGLFRLLLQKVPKPPEPLLNRPQLIESVMNLISQRKAVLLTGSVFKGKTTIAQMVSSSLCPDAWWFNLSGRRLDQVDNIFLVLSSRIKDKDCPNLIIIDDIDVSPESYRIYKTSLDLVLHTAHLSGLNVILTAQGSPVDTLPIQDFGDAEIIEVPELSIDETEALCIEHGCHQELSKVWGPLIQIWTRGHPKLVQIRIAELHEYNWPNPTEEDVIKESHAVESFRKTSRIMLKQSASSSEIELVYLISECSILMHRTIAVRLSEFVEGISNGGDVIDSLTGKWVELIDNQWIRTTALIKGAAKDVWSTEKNKWAHNCIHDAILLSGKILDPSEAAAALFHAYIGGHAGRISNIALKLQKISEFPCVKPPIPAPASLAAKSEK